MARLYSHLKYLAFPEQLQALRAGQVAPPVHIRIKPTNVCNHDCWYCAYHSSDLQLGDQMGLRDTIPAEKMEEIVEDVIALGVKAVTFSGGGEPLLYKPLPGVIAKLASGGVRTAAITNGSNLKGAVAEALAEHATWVRISVDAWDDESYSKARRIPDGSFTKLLDNMSAFAATGSECVLGVSFIVGHDNSAHLLDACRRFKDAGARHVKLSGVVVGNSAEENNRYHDSIRELVGEQIEAARAELEGDGFSVIDHYHELANLFDKEYHLCPFLMFLTVIGADCKVYTCQDKAYTESGTLGSITDRRFREYWFSEDNRRRIFNFDPAERCRHHCVAHAKNLSILEYLSLDPVHQMFV